MDPIVFALSCVALLATPGPTNTLLATSGASAGIARSLPLLLAEILGYLTSILVLTTLVGPVVAVLPAFGVILHAAVAAYLLFLAWKLWRQGVSRFDDAAPIAFTSVLVTTLLNPKGIIFAFAILPQGEKLGTLLPWLAALALQIVVIGGTWIVAGATLRRGLRGLVSAEIGYRVSALALTAMAGAVTANAFR